MTRECGEEEASAAVRPLLVLLAVYRRAVSPLLGPRCRFVPSCSEYAVGALRRHGLVKGLALSVWRLLRCQPFCHGGYDPVPPRHERRGDQLSPGLQPQVDPREPALPGDAGMTTVRGASTC